MAAGAIVVKEDRPKPFAAIETELLNDDSDSSSLALDGIVLASANEWDAVPGSPCPIQGQIHDTIRRAARILEDYRSGALAYKSNDSDIPQSQGEDSAQNPMP